MSIDLDVLTNQIAQIRAENRAKGKRTTEPTQKVFELGPSYNWTQDPKGFKKENNGTIPLNRCVMCGYKYVGWRQAAPFCNICHLAQVGDSVIDEHWRTWIGGHVRIPEDETEDQFVIRHMKKDADAEYQRKKTESVKSDFKRAIDLA